MAKINENKEKPTGIEISGVVLTQRAIEAIKTLQNENNSFLNYLQCELADVICYIADCDHVEYSMKQKQFEMIKKINAARSYLRDFENPNPTEPELPESLS